MTLPPDPQPASTFAENDLLGERYRVEAFLARGGMGEVYRAHDLDLDVPVALKIIRPEIAIDPLALRKFKQEVLTARSVTHANVCRIYDLGRHRDQSLDVSFLTMEFLPGQTLAQRLEARGPMRASEALAIVRQLALGLDSAHRAGIVHRDFKAANVLLVPGKDGERAVITDFGLAMGMEWQRPASDSRDLSTSALRAAADSRESATSTESHDQETVWSGIGDVFSEDPASWPPASFESESSARVILGTPAYMAPEQVRGEAVGPAADLYALGVTLFEMRTGELPFLSESPAETALMRLRQPPPAPSSFASIEPEWEKAILRLLSLDPAERYASADDLVRALDGTARPTRDAQRSLPAEHDSFVGRRALLDTIAASLEPTGALVTLLGPGGTGKTRLARRYGWESLPHWPGGVWFADLTEARDATGIVSAVATALGVPLGRGDGIDVLGRAIDARGRALVILDNLEQVASFASATLGTWRGRARDASFLITSRERLQLPGEVVVEVEPLDPESEAVELFEVRARAQRPGFEVTEENRGTVVEIARLLDGLPLALELAASRLRMLTLDQLRARLNDRFAVLSGSTQGRHATLRAALDWSWALLTPWEKSALAQAAVFQGGFTLEAAEAVVDLSDRAEAPLMLDVIQSLVDKSWLRARVIQQSPRFGMLVIVQEYAARKLAEETGLASRAQVEARHGAHFATFGTARAIESLERKGGAERGRLLHLEIDNLVAACRTACGGSREFASQSIAGQTYVAAAIVFDLAGPSESSIQLAQPVLAHLDDSSLRGRVLAALAWAEYRAGKNQDARAHCDEALELARRHGDRMLEASALNSLGNLRRLRGTTEETRSLFEAALAIDRADGRRRAEGLVLGNLGGLEQTLGRFDEARACYETALRIQREVGDRRSEAGMLRNLASVYHNVGNLEQSRRHFEAALAIQREIGDLRAEANLLGDLGVISHSQGDLQAARSSYEAGLAKQRAVGNRADQGVMLGNLGAVMFEQGDLKEAQSYFEQALAVHRECGSRVNEGAVLGNLGAVHLEQGRPQEARAHHEAAMAIYRDVGARRHQASALMDLGVLDRSDDRLDDAAERFSTALEIVREIGDRGQEGVLLTELALLRSRQGQPAEARSLVAEGVEKLRSLGHDLELAKALCRAGTIDLQTGDATSALERLQEAERVAEALRAASGSELVRAIGRLRAELTPS